MAIYLSSIIGSPCIGCYSLVTDETLIVPGSIPSKKTQRLTEWLNTKVICTSVGGTVLIGSLACANSHGILLPHIIRDRELKAINDCFNGNITVMETRKTAYGNLVLSNDKGAVVDPSFKSSEIQQISETLCVEAVPSEIAGLPYVGKLATTTNKGTLAHPLLKDSERKLLEDVLKVPVDVGTVNCGIPYVGTGLLANRHAAVAGSMTTGPEMFMIENALDIVKEEE